MDTANADFSSHPNRVLRTLSGRGRIRHERVLPGLDFLRNCADVVGLLCSNARTLKKEAFPHFMTLTCNPHRRLQRELCMFCIHPEVVSPG